MRVPQTLRTSTRKTSTRKATVVHEPLRKPLRPRYYWIFDQVVRRKRTQQDVAEEVGLTQVRVSQICTVVGAWMERIWDESLPELDEEDLWVYSYLIQLRIRAQEEGRAPLDEDVPDIIARCLCDLEAIPYEKPGAN